MGDKLTQKTCEDFAAALAAKEAVPGGGGAAALAGALAAALCSMVGNFTVGKKTYAAVEEDVQAMLVKAEAARIRLLELVDEDAKAFLPLSEAYAIPRDDPSRATKIESATKAACAAPLQMMRQTVAVIALLEEMGQKGSKMLLSDVGCGALLARAALEAAAINVAVNTKALKDRSFARSLDDESAALMDEYVPRAQACANRVLKMLQS